MNLNAARLGRAFVASVLLLLLAGAAAVAAADIGHKDFGDAGGSAVSGSKPESKLWYAAGTWWASMQSSTSTGFWIYKLDPNDNWIKTSTPLDPRNGTRADTLWDGTHLYVASQKWKADGGATGTGSSYETRLYRFSYSGGTYTLDNGFPASIRTGIQSETLVIAKDSTGMLWATWTQKSGSGNLVYTNHTIANNDANWSAPAFLPVGSQGVGVTTKADDISTIISFNPNGQHRIGVLWSNQADKKDYFAWHADGDSDTVWTAETMVSATSGDPSPADDHLNVKTDSSGRLYAVAKTSNTSSSQPMENLLVRQPGGGWSDFPVATVHDSPTRAILELDETAGKLHVFETGGHDGSGSGQSGGDIYEKTSSTSSISFPSGLGTPVIRDDTSPTNGGKMNDASSTKQNVDASTGVVVICFNDSLDYYWHANESLGGGGGPKASFVATTPTSGGVNLNVSFDGTASTGTGLTYSWTFGDGGTDTTTATPTHQYAAPGTYTVALKVTDGSSATDTQTRVGYVVIDSAPSASFTKDKTSGNAALTVNFDGSTSTGSNLVYAWNFGDPASNGLNISALQKPSHIFNTANTYTVSLTVSNAAGSSGPVTQQITVNTGSTPTTITLNPVADASVNSATANVDKNYGTLNPMRTREDPTTPNTYRPYYQFNVPAFSGTVQSVKLRLYVTTASSTMTQSVYLVGNGWTESAVTWNNAPALPGSSIGSGIAGTVNAYVEFTLTTPITPSSTISVALKSSGTTSVYFSSREDATNKPQLVIVYQ